MSFSIGLLCLYLPMCCSHLQCRKTHYESLTLPSCSRPKFPNICNTCSFRMERLQEYSRHQLVNFLPCANYEVLRFASMANGLFGPAVALPSTVEENVESMGGLQVMYKNPGDISFRNDISAEGIEQTLQQSGKSLALDLSICYAANVEEYLGEIGQCLIRKASIIDSLALNVSKMKPVRKGQMVFASATSSFRTKDSLFVMDANTSEWSIMPDDSFVCVGLVPGEESALVQGVTESNDFELLSPECRTLYSTLVSRLKTRALVVTDPISYDSERVDWHSYKQIGLFMVDLEKVRKIMRAGTLMFLSFSQKAIFGLHVMDSNPTFFSNMSHHGLVSSVGMALAGTDFDARFQASVAALRLMDKPGAFAAWNVLMAVRTVLEAEKCGTKNTREALMYSRTVNDFITEYDESDVEVLATAMELSESEKQILIERNVKVEGNVIDLEDVGARNEEGCDHDKIGALNRPKLKGRRKVAGCNVRGGRGVPVMSGDPYISYRSRGKRYRISVRDGKVMFSKRSEMIEDFNLFRNITSVEVGLDSIHVAKDSCEHEEGIIDDQIVNALLRGEHGYSRARWIWSLILFGIIPVDQESTTLSYVFGADLNIDNESGYKIRAAMTSVCLTRAVTYTDGTNLWIDVMDNMKLREVKKQEPGWFYIKSEETDLRSIDMETLRECSITSRMGIGKHEMQTAGSGRVTL